MALLNLKLPPDIEILIKLYDIKNGTIQEISEKLGLSLTTGKIYKIKDTLIQLHILEKTNILGTTNLGRGEKKAIIFEVNHDTLDQIFFGELATSRLRDRALSVTSPIRTVFLGRKKLGILKNLAKY
jgi:hypothetical protein